MNNKVLLQPAFILHSRPYLNSSLIVNLLTQDYGVVHLVAKGVRREKSKLKGLLQPCTPLLINYINKSSLGILIDVETDGYNEKIPNDKIVYALYLNELLVNLLHEHDPHFNLFNVYKEVLLEMLGEKSIEHILRKFEMKLLNEIGYGIDFFKDAQTGDDIIEENLYRFLPNLGFEEVDESNVAKTFFGKNIIRIGKMQFDSTEVLSDSRLILRATIANKLGNYKLKSRSLLMNIDNNK